MKRFQRKCEKLLGITHDHFGGKKQCFGFDPERKLHTIKEKDIQRLIAEREKEGLLPQSIPNEMTIWNQLINFAKRMGYMIPGISIADLKKANGIKIGKGKLRFLTLDEEARLLEEIHPKKSVRGLANYEDQDNEIRRKRQDLHDLVILLLDTGARYSEIGEIKWSSIDMLSRTIYLFHPKVQNQSILHMSNRVLRSISQIFRPQPYRICIHRHYFRKRGSEVLFVPVLATLAAVRGLRESVSTLCAIHLRVVWFRLGYRSRTSSKSLDMRPFR